MKNTILSFNSPASDWVSALPIGNGRLGAMIYGSVAEEILQFNEETLWSGYYDPDADNPDCRERLDELRSLIFSGNLTEAEQLAAKYLVCRGNGSKRHDDEPYPYGSFQTAGELHIKLHPEAACTEYCRTLDISSGLASVDYVKNGISYRRRTVASPDCNCIAACFEADAEFNTALEYIREDCEISCKPEQASISLRGAFDDGRGISYAGHVRILTDGKLSTDGRQLLVHGARKIEAFYSLCTTYGDKADPMSRAESFTADAAALGFAELSARTASFYGEMMSRAELDLGTEDYQGELSVDERLALLREGKPEAAGLTALIELYWQFGRYLMLASSWSCVLPANLQGLWSPDYHTIWSGDYHININIQMNYWLTELTGLPECGDAFLRYISFISEHGQRTAQIQYGCRGWVAHTITNPWGFTAPGEGVSWGSFMCAGAWCCEHIWERWLFSRDLEQLREYYPILRSSCEFFLDFLVEDPRTGYLVTAPSNSPENHYRDPATGKTVAICAGPTMDCSILYELFSNTAEAADLLGVDEELAAELLAARDRLPPLRIGKHGQIMEWQEDYEETDPGHRHLSMLYALHPSNQITRDRTPELLEAAKRSIERRLSSGGGHTGWSRAWIINFYARLGMGDEAQRHIRALLERSTYPNLFDAHPPFQIDGNFGAVAGIAEMLLQSHDSFIELLPALPSEWRRGSFHGLRARGGFTVDATWEDGRLCEVTIESRLGLPCELRANGRVKCLQLAAGERVTLKAW